MGPLVRPLPLGDTWLENYCDCNQSFVYLNSGFLYDGTTASVIALPGDASGGGGFAKPSDNGLVPAFVSAADGTTHSFV